ncbi:hypothetical protein [Flavobacterium sp.]|uniref:hypothetical protein n=1 Tax=Flavobacterium sp. TaxID=239 RepID=UPI0037C0BC07
MKQVIQLDTAGYFVGFATADQSPLEPGVFLLPANCIDVAAPAIPEGKMAKWNGAWVFEDIDQPVVEDEPEAVPLTYAQLRAAEYPLMTDYLDGVVKGDQAQIDKYIADCQAVKAKYPKP